MTPPSAAPRAVSFPLAVLLALALLAVLEAVRLPAGHRGTPAETLELVRVLVGVGAVVLCGPVIATSALGALRLAERRPLPRVVSSLGLLLLGLLAPWAVAWNQVPLKGFVVTLVLVATVAAAVTTGLAHASRTRWRRAGPLLALVGFVVLDGLNHAREPLGYPGVHLLFFQASLPLLAVALLPFARGALDRRGVRWSLGGAVVLGAVAGGPEPAQRPQALAETMLGRTFAIWRPWTEQDEPATPPPPPVPLAEAEADFARYSGLPSLPSGFRFEDHHVLLITSEATRFDGTSLASTNLATTPNLAALAREALVFRAAVSPSSTTLGSSAALLTHRLPSMAPLDVWRKPWHGELRAEAETIPERLAAAGRHTFWTGHDHKTCFSLAMPGFDQGFETVRLEDTERDGADPDTDARVARRAVETLRTAARRRERFFGWVFFGSPHGPYLTRRPDWPAETEHDRWLQELWEMDRHLGTVLDELRRLGLWEDTVIVFTGDHGEAFGEHGGDRHGNGVHREVRHVPLVVRVPNTPAAVLETPVATQHVLPWLMLRAGGPEARVREATLTELAATTVPMMRATGGAVVSEILGPHRMESVLVYPERSVYLDLVAGERRAYDLSSDPGEQINVWRRDPAAFPELHARAEAYLQVRAGLRRYHITPTRAAPE